MCGGRPFARELGVQNTNGIVLPNYFLREPPFSTGRRGHIGVMSVHEMSHSERSLR